MMAACGDMALRWHPELEDSDPNLRQRGGVVVAGYRSIAAEAGRNDKLIARWLDKAREVKKGIWRADSDAKDGATTKPDGAETPKAETKPPVKDGQPATPEPKGVTVFICPENEQYHRATCRYAGKNKAAVSLRQALDIGYAPCKFCRPPDH